MVFRATAFEPADRNQLHALPDAERRALGEPNPRKYNQRRVTMKGIYHVK